MSASRAVENPVLAPVGAFRDGDDFLATLWMERVRDPHRTGHLLGAGSSPFVG